jgi:hypothetical protein
MRPYFAVTVMVAACSASNTGPGPGPGSGSGSSVSQLVFAVVGDTRPASPDDTANYPTDIITKIYQDIAAESSKPVFAVGTGDYMFASTSGSEQAPQLDKYMGARGNFSGPLYPAMGNHECTGATDSNCGQGNRDGITSNMTEFIHTMLEPNGIDSPYYVENIKATDNSWTAKFVFVACNAWSSTQASWLDTQLAQSTTYTFVVRHESASAVSGTPCSQSQSIITSHPLTLLIVGHTHEYRHESFDKEIIVGNGGAPLTSGLNYGYVIVSRNSSGTLTVTAYDYMTHATLDTFAIQASGAGA